MDAQVATAGDVADSVVGGARRVVARVVSGRCCPARWCLLSGGNGSAHGGCPSVSSAASCRRAGSCPCRGWQGLGQRRRPRKLEHAVSSSWPGPLTRCDRQSGLGTRRMRQCPTWPRWRTRPVVREWITSCGGRAGSTAWSCSLSPDRWRSARFSPTASTAGRSAPGWPAWRLKHSARRMGCL